MTLLNLTPDELLTTTRSVRRRLDLDRPVDLDVVEECLRIAQQAPSASNRQTWHWLVVTDPDLRAGIAERYRRSWEAYKVAQSTTTPAPGQVWSEERQATQARVSASAQYLADNLHRVPVHVIPCLEGDEATYPASMRAGYWGSLLPAAWSFMLALRARGLGAAWTTLHLVHAGEVAELLGIPPGITQGALLPVAYTLGTDFRPAPREPLASSLHLNGW
ncbi:nitroreductase family protein [Frankia sp. CNm7]|uniref:Nitroreductase family protein n=1 Tax=Frankia nepalensis TaxID=1836974 RepID=A0A937RK21_9ACTN|nr:nitroreductase family protein [Frankia nepalensis]MBL7496260.1 nitroreductase family protein [Frankia nepalensis]MBL7516200.1 nitroreductase family protein [Frankia nepalensis]MBL7523202.1 nitroreductase family protein [Frankia nepalensis]MBL7633723.1 nitroreductase family protein [Frankia nepalensis]